jgi:hypothetical protein
MSETDAQTGALSPRTWRFAALLPARNIYFAILIFACGANGLSTKLLDSFIYADVHVSWVVLLGLILACWACLRAPDEILRRSDLVVGAVILPLLLWPERDPSWLALTILATYIILTRENSPSLRAGAFIALALAVQSLWARFIQAYLSGPLEQVDLGAVSLFLGNPSHGNQMNFSHGPGGIIVAWACTSFANASLAFLLWVAVTRTVRPVPVRSEWFSILGVFATVFVINTTRLVFMAQSLPMYQLVHGPVGAFWTNLLMLLSSLAWAAFGLRRELVS